MPLSNLLWLPVLSLVAYTPFLCHMDVKHRDIGTHKIWLPLITINIPIMLALFALGIYDVWTVLLSLIGVGLWFVSMRLNIINGADFVFLALISVFLVINPNGGRLVYLPFIIFLIVWMAASVWFIFLRNIRNQIRRGEKKIFENGIQIENGLPMMIPISLALISAVMWG